MLRFWAAVGIGLTALIAVGLAYVGLVDWAFRILGNEDPRG